MCVAEDKLLQAQRPAMSHRVTRQRVVLTDFSHLLIVNKLLYPSRLVLVSHLEHQVLVHVNALERLAVCF